MARAGFSQPGDEGTPRVVISRKIAKQHPDAKGNPKKVGDTISDRRQTVRDHRPVRDGLDDSRRRHRDGYRDGAQVVNEPKESVSCIYIEGTDPAQNTALSKAIEQAHPGFDARSMNEAQANFGSLMGQVDSFLLMTVSLALVVGIVGIINTMLMSTTERFAEFGVLRHQRLVAGQYPGSRDARECLSRLAWPVWGGACSRRSGRR